MSRRIVLGAGVALGAAAAGAGLAWYRYRTPADAARDAGAVALLWALELERPEGGTLKVASLRGKPLLINFWATWCKPCLRELPEIERWYQDHRVRGWQVLALAVDQLKPVQEFLARRPLALTVAMAGMDGTDLIHQLGNHAGGMPFTVALDAAGQVRHRKLGETHYEELADWAKKMG